MAASKPLPLSPLISPSLFCEICDDVISFSTQQQREWKKERENYGAITLSIVFTHLFVF
jgi:hypothetical protein